MKLVSVIVVAYNSSSTIRETLDSIYEQDYKEIELIVADDCSTDNTCEIASEWCDKNRQRFVECKIVKADKNSGVSGNGNRGLKAANGFYLKMVDGDDCLTPNCIKDCVEFLGERHNEVVISKVTAFGVNEQRVAFMQSIIDSGYKILSYSPKKQFYKMLDCSYYISPIQVFMTKETMDNLGGFDERFPMMEDYPYQIKVFTENMKLSFLDCETGRYRVSEDSLCQAFSDAYLQSWIDYFYLVKRQLLLKHHRYINFLEQTVYCYSTKMKLLYGENDPKYQRSRLLFFLVPSIMVKGAKSNTKA